MVMKIRDSSEVQQPIGDLDILVARIHQDLRKERKARAWRHRAPILRRIAIAMLLVAMSIAIMMLSGPHAVI